MNILVQCLNGRDETAHDSAEETYGDREGEYLNVETSRLHKHELRRNERAECAEPGGCEDDSSDATERG